MFHSKVEGYLLWHGIRKENVQKRKCIITEPRLPHIRLRTTDCVKRRQQLCQVELLLAEAPQGTAISHYHLHSRGALKSPTESATGSGRQVAVLRKEPSTR